MIRVGLAWAAVMVWLWGLGTALAAPNGIADTTVLSLKSADTGIDYRLYIRTPKGYGSTSQLYPVIYILDADYAFPLVHAIAEHFEDRQNMPRVILVGIAYPGGAHDGDIYRLSRSRDYTPSHTLEGGYGKRYQAVSGGGAAFRDFMESQLFPYIEKRFLASDKRTLVGHSFGGLFASFVMLTKPHSYSNYLIVSPSYWYDDRVIFDLEKSYAGNHKDLPVHAFFSVGAFENRPQNGRAMVDDLRALQAKITARGYENFHSTLQMFEGETHNSVFPAAVSRGLRVLFSR